MLTLDQQWTLIAKNHAKWVVLSTSARSAFLELRPEGDLSTVLGTNPQYKELLELGFLKPKTPGTRVTATDEAWQIRMAFRWLRANCDWTPRNWLSNHIHSHLDEGECTYLKQRSAGYRASARLETKAASEDWIERFLDQSESPHLTNEDTRFYGHTRKDLSRILPLMARLVRLLVARPQPLGWLELSALVAVHERGLLWHATLAGIRRLLFFPRLREEDLALVIGLWPPISERLHRPPAVPSTALASPPQNVFQAAFWMEDVASVAWACAASPPSLRADGRYLQTRARRELAERMIVLPDWVTHVLRLEPVTSEGRSADIQYPRLNTALQVLLAFEWVQAERHELRITNAGQRWLSMNGRDRLAVLLGMFRPGAEEDPHYRIPLGHIRLLPGEYGLFQKAPSKSLYLGPSYYPRRELARAFGRLVVGSYHACRDFFEYESRVNNPLGREDAWHVRRAYGESPFSHDLLPSGNEGFVFVSRSHHGDDLIWTRAGLEEAWHTMLLCFLVERLVPLGGAAMGHDGTKGNGLFHFAMTDIGRYLLGLADDFEYAHAPSGEVVVQSNFEIVFLDPNPIVEATCGRFCERASKSRHVGTLFRITKRSCIGAAAAGMTVEAAMKTLTQASRKPIPENVAHEIKSWFGQCRMISLRTALLIECPDAETATQVEQSGVRGLSRLNDRTLEASVEPGYDGRKSIEKRLRERGIFLKPGANEETIEEDYDL